MHNPSVLAHEQQGESAQDLLLARHAEAIRRLHKRSIADIIEIGRILVECKKLLEHGDWLPWLEREFAWSERTARNYIAVYDFFESKSANVADLSIDLSSLYLIAAPSTPPEARAEIIDRAGAGEAISRGEVQHVVRQAKHHQATSRRRSASVSVEEVLERSGCAVLRKLSAIEQRLSFELAKTEGAEIGLEWAEARASLKRRYRDILLALDFAEAAAEPSIRKIVEEIPQEQRSATAKRLREASEFFAKLCSELIRNSIVEKCPSGPAKLANPMSRQLGGDRVSKR